jgi:hypothetical protein
MNNGLWIVCGVLVFVILLNLGLVISAIRYRKSNPQPLLGKSISELLNPWKEEDEALNDLHRQVESLTKRGDHPDDG